MPDAEGPKVTFEGEEFELRTGPMSKLAVAQFLDTISDEDPNAMVPAGLMLRLLRASIVKKDWRRFENLCDDAEDQDGLIDRAFEQIIVPRLSGVLGVESGHPTGQPSDSTDGQKGTLLKSVPNSDAKVLELAHGRLDRLYMLREAQKQSRSA